jgi:hypothetical protein
MRTDIAARRDELEVWISQSESKAFMCRQLGCKPDTLNSWLTKLGLNYEGNQPMRGKPSAVRLSAGDYAKTPNPKPHILRLKLLQDGHDHVCDSCGTSEWLDVPVPLELHHVDGNRFNNERINLQILCPNCHALTPNHAGKGKRSRN